MASSHPTTQSSRSLKASAEYDVALSFWTVSFQYLMLVENVAREIVSNLNPLGLTKLHSEGPITEDELVEATRWSDQSLVIPLLFNLYHGIELLVKGFLLITPGVQVKPQHSIQRLCRGFSAAYPNEIELNAFLKKYTEESQLPPLLRDFLRDNALTFADLYQALRYPIDQDFVDLKRYVRLKYKGQQGVHFFRELDEEIKSIRPLAVRLGRSLEPKQENGQQ
jgi:hypothetical protein